MNNLLSNFFSDMNRSFYYGCFMFGMIVFLMGKVFDKFFTGKFKKNIKYLNDPNKAVFFSVFLMGFVFLIIGVICDFYFEYPISWWLGTGALLVGGILGLVPFSFTDKKK